MARVSGNSAIAALSAGRTSDSYALCDGASGVGILAGSAVNCYGSSAANQGIQANDNVEASRGVCGGGADGISARTAQTTLAPAPPASA